MSTATCPNCGHSLTVRLLELDGPAPRPSLRFEAGPPDLPELWALADRSIARAGRPGAAPVAALRGRPRSPDLPELWALADRSIARAGRPGAAPVAALRGRPRRPADCPPAARVARHWPRPAESLGSGCGYARCARRPAADRRQEWQDLGWHGCRVPGRRRRWWPPGDAGRRRVDARPRR